MVLYHIAFPPAALWPLAWIALAPLFYAMAGSTPGTAAIGSALAGCGLALLSLSGFRHLTIAAYISPAIIAGVYYAAVGAGISWITRRKGVSLLWVVPPVWTAYEFLRSVILRTGKDDRIVEVVEVGEIFRTGRTKLGTIVALPVVFRRHNGVTMEQKMIVQFRQLGGKASCVVHGPYGIPREIE